MSQWKVNPDTNLYFVTTTIVRWLNIFTSEPFFRIIIEDLNYCMSNKGLKLYGYVIMPNHVHYILSTSEGISLSEVMRDFNRHTSRKISEALKTNNNRDNLRLFAQTADFDGRGNIYKIWQEGFHPMAVESDKFFMEKLQYIHDNPVRKGFVEKVEHWKYSSARNYLNDDHSVIEVEFL